MYKTTIAVEGMMCGMCEAHVNDAVRAAVNVKKVTSSRSAGQTVIISEDEINADTVKDAIEKTGYTVGEIKSEPYESKGLFARFKK